MTEEIQAGQKYHQLLQGILVDSEITLKKLISGHGRGLHGIAAARPAHLEPEREVLQKCERSHNVNISHGCSSPDEGFYRNDFTP
jgi:hypothetical protein